MSEYFKNKYRVATTRLGDWDYSWPAMYYVTICTKNRVCCLGEIMDDNVYLSEIGKVVFEDLLKVPEWRPYVLLDNFIIMPNHLHVIFVIKEDNDFVQGRDTVNRVFTVGKYGPLQSKSLSSIVNTFKGGVTRQCHERKLDFHWQSNYFEHIIKNDDDYARIKKYIADNPIQWAGDRNNPNNIKYA